jgi:hypothetical protein
MKKIKSIKKQMLVIGCIIILLGTSTISVATSNQQKQSLINDNQTVKISILDTTSGQISKTQHVISSEQAQMIIQAFFETKMTSDSFYQQTQQKLKILQDNDLISSKTATKLTNMFTVHKNLFNNKHISSRTAAYFSTVNLINIVMFGLKGEKNATIFERDLIQLPFFNGTISPQFSLASKFKGNGTIFSLGLLGLKYSYGQNQTKYPAFPHFPEITGGVIAFTGILIEVESAQPGYPGYFIVGLGMSLFTAWNKTG